jgi:hypothetical protein
MKKLIIVFAVLMTTFGSCRESIKNSSSSKGDMKFQQLSDEFLAGYLAWRPELSVSLGFHEFDGKISDISKKSIVRELTRLKLFDQMLNEFDTASLSTGMHYDFSILQCGIKNELFNFEEIEPFTRNPMTYASAMNVSIYIKRNFAPLEDRLKSIIAFEKNASVIFEAAKSNLSDSLAKQYIETAILIANGSVDFLGNDLLIALKGMKNDSLMDEFKSANNKAISEVKAYVKYLKEEKLPKANNKYALGREKYRKMLLYGEDISMPSEKILEIGLAELQKEKDVFNATAKIINPQKKSVEVYQNLQKEHPTSDSLLPTIKKNVEAIRQFLIDKKIVTIPSEANVSVEATPKYARSTSTASMDSPGAFEK